MSRERSQSRFGKFMLTILEVVPGVEVHRLDYRFIFTGRFTSVFQEWKDLDIGILYLQISPEDISHDLGLVTRSDLQALGRRKNLEEDVVEHLISGIADITGETIHTFLWIEFASKMIEDLLSKYSLDQIIPLLRQNIDSFYGTTLRGINAGEKIRKRSIHSVAYFPVDLLVVRFITCSFLDSKG